MASRLRSARCDQAPCQRRVRAAPNCGLFWLGAGRPGSRLTRQRRLLWCRRMARCALTPSFETSPFRWRRSRPRSSDRASFGSPPIARRVRWPVILTDNHRHRLRPDLRRPRRLSTRRAPMTPNFQLEDISSRARGSCLRRTEPSPTRLIRAEPLVASFQAM